MYIRGLGYSNLITGGIYMFTLVMVLQLIGLPFSIYSTFVIEEKYGFNKTTITTFVLDLLKSTLLSIIIMLPVLCALLWFLSLWETMLG